MSKFTDIDVPIRSGKLILIIEPCKLISGPGLCSKTISKEISYG
jgi:hypothetical protein